MPMQVALRVYTKRPLRDTIGRFRRANTRLLKFQQEELRSTAPRLERYIKEEAPKRTGEFAEAHTVKVRPYAARLEVMAPEPLASFIRFGTKDAAPYQIPTNPAAKGPLSFYWEKLGRWVVFRRVMHPGISANDYLDRAVTRWWPETTQVLNKIALRWIYEVVGR